LEGWGHNNKKAGGASADQGKCRKKKGSEKFPRRRVQRGNINQNRGGGDQGATDKRGKKDKEKKILGRDPENFVLKRKESAGSPGKFDPKTNPQPAQDLGLWNWNGGLELTFVV